VLGLSPILETQLSMTFFGSPAPMPMLVARLLLLQLPLVSVSSMFYLKMSAAMVAVYSSSEINRDFRIHVYGCDQDNRRINTLVGVSGAIRLIGEELFYKFVSRAYRDGLDKTVCKLRRGIVFTFYVK
jgi:hypothetical protein